MKGWQWPALWSAFVLVVSSCSDDTREKEDSSGPAIVPCPTALDVKVETPPDPGPPEAAPTIDCGATTIPEGTILRRRPYLQSVTQTSLMIAWTTTAAGSAKVRIGESKDGPWSEFAAASELFDMARTTDTENYFAHAAAVTGLQPGRAYCYEVMVDGQTLASGISLNTAWESKDRPVRVLAFGDSGNASPEQKALRDVFMQHEFDVFLHLGDMAYGSGTFPEFEERVFDIYRDFMQRVPSFPTIGNHEYGTDRGQPYLDVYYLFEQALRAEDQERYYSFDYGNVHFVSLDSNGEMLTPIALDLSNTRDDDMIDWLTADLAKSKADWKVAFFHHPPFSLYPDRGDNVLVINQIMPALEAGGVDLVLLGHDHHYVRSLPVRGECEIPGGKRAIPYIVVGSGGAGLTPAVSPDDWYVAVKNDQTHAFLSVTFQDCKASARAIGLDGQDIDTFELDGCD